MSRRYDSRTTIFSPEGRLYQVEYAMEAISHAGTAIGILAKDGVVLAAERKITSKLLDQDTSAEKMHAISKNIVCAVAGLDSDASRLVNDARNIAQEHLRSYDEEMPVSMLVTKLSNIKQSYTQFGGLRPYGVSFIYAGWDEISGYQLYQSNPSGNYSGWLATSVGANTAATQTLLKQHYQNDLSLKEACELALRVLSKTMDSTSLTSERIEFSTIGGSTDGPVRKVWLATEIDELIANTDLTKKEE